MPWSVLSIWPGAVEAACHDAGQIFGLQTEMPSARAFRGRRWLTSGWYCADGVAMLSSGMTDLKSNLDPTGADDGSNGQAIRLAVSTVIFSICDDDRAQGRKSLWLPLVRRTRAPHKGKWALPGGWIDDNESLSEAASRTLADTTGLRPSYLEQLYTFGRRDRSPDGRVVSTVYTALVPSSDVAAAQEMLNVRWFRADTLPSLAFDHNRIAQYALWRLRNKVEYAHVAFHFLDETFSVAQLREVYEAILGRQLDPTNFRRRVEATGTIVPTSKQATGGRHRPARLYRCQVPQDELLHGPLGQDA